MMQLGGGLSNLLKEGSRHFSGTEETILSNIEACKQLSAITRTSLGPYGMNKMIVNSIEKLFVTSDAATILKEMDVHHLAAKLIVMAAKMQESEVGDGTNLVVILAGELLHMAEELIKMGLHPSDIISGFEKASQKTLEILPDLTCFNALDLTDPQTVEKCLRPVIASKIYGFEDHLAHCAASACLIVTENSQKFDMDNLRIVKLQGGVLSQSDFYKGLMLKRGAEGNVKHVNNARVAVYNCPLDTQYADTKGTILIKSAQELKDYTSGEEAVAEKFINEVADAGVNVVVCGGSVSDICMHYLEQRELMVVKVSSKFELRRISRMLGGNIIVRLGGPTPDEIGHADVVTVEEISSTKVTIFKREAENSRLATVVLRANTQNVLDDAERALDDAFNTFRMIRKNPKFLPGAGATEAELAKRLKDFGQTVPGLDQYAVVRFGQAFEIIPKTLAEVVGQNANEILPTIYKEGNPNCGVDIEGSGIVDVSDTVIDHILTKDWAVRLATDVALTVLRVDQIIMAKPSGGPNPNKKPPVEEED